MEVGAACFRYRTIGLIKVLCGVLVPAIVSSLSTFEPGSPERTFLMQTSIVLSVLGTLSVALEDFFQFGARATAMKTCVMIIDKEFWYDKFTSAAHTLVDVPHRHASFDSKVGWRFTSMEQTFIWTFLLIP